MAASTAVPPLFQDVEGCLGRQRLAGGGHCRGGRIIRSAWPKLFSDRPVAGQSWIDRNLIIRMKLMDLIGNGRS